MIDVHCHILPDEVVADLESYSARDEYFGVLARTKGAKFATGDDLASLVVKGTVQGGVAFGFAFRDVDICREINDYVAAFCKSQGGRFLGLAVINPEAPGALREAERALSLGLRGFGELFPSGHGYLLTGVGMNRLAGLAEEAGALLLIHVNEKLGHAYPGKGNVGPEEAWEFASRHPRVKIVYAHLGGGLPFYASMPEVAALENVAYDTAAQPFLYKSTVYRVLKETGMLQRTLLGSDWPLLGPTRYLNSLNNSGLSGQDIERVTWKNAISYFGYDFHLGEEGNREVGQNSLS